MNKKTQYMWGLALSVVSGTHGGLRMDAPRMPCGFLL